MILMLDNFDSFTYNLADYLLQLGAKVDFIRNNIKPETINKQYKGIIISPGPGMPSEAGHLMSFISTYAGQIPMLGICLGHQAIGQYYNATLAVALKPMHGKISEIICDEDPIFVNIPKKFKVVRYHSMILKDLPEQIKPIAWAGSEIMALKHRSLPVYGVQFHPEAVKTEFGMQILKNWISMLNDDRLNDKTLY